MTARHVKLMGEHVGKRLVLWDIDKTLLDVDGVGFEIFSAAFAEYSGLTEHQETRGAGRTEWRWFHDTLLANSVDPADDGFARFLDVQDRLFAARTADLVERGRVLAGAERVLRHCAGDSDIVSSLLTGNTRRNAERKLAAFGLDDLVDFSLGPVWSLIMSVVRCCGARASHHTGGVRPRSSAGSCRSGSLCR
ncbi:HAD family hydrolase, partial [Nocardiopsis rhodophaea]|uniref:HAD family hydrolase n=1 Tax=Nocardiopsis rhodophaea TaxID=280238 RepID=UPI0031D8BEA0